MFRMIRDIFASGFPCKLWYLWCMLPPHLDGFRNHDKVYCAPSTPFHWVHNLFSVFWMIRTHIKHLGVPYMYMKYPYLAVPVVKKWKATVSMCTHILIGIRKIFPKSVLTTGWNETDIFLVVDFMTSWNQCPADAVLACTTYTCTCKSCIMHASNNYNNTGNDNFSCLRIRNYNITTLYFKNKTGSGAGNPK